MIIEAKITVMIGQRGEEDRWVSYAWLGSPEGRATTTTTPMIEAPQILSMYALTVCMHGILLSSCSASELNPSTVLTPVSVGSPCYGRFSASRQRKK